MRYHKLDDRLARLTARLLIRKIFQALGLDRESTLNDWRKDEQGRPFLKNSNADISISHANPWAVSAVAIRCRIGIDVETFQPLELKALTPYFTDIEKENIQNAEHPKVEALHYWSMREAILKADGRGLLAPETTIRNITNVRTPTGAKWQVKNFDFDDGCLYLAYARDSHSLSRKAWNFTELLQL